MNNDQNEFMIRYTANLEDYESIIKDSDQCWDDSATLQLKKEVNKLKDTEDDCAYHSIKVCLSDGCIVSILYIPKQPDTFELHTQIRHAFANDIKETDVVIFNLFNIRQSLQKLLITALYSLVKLCEWEYPQYGKRAGGKEKTKKECLFHTYLEEHIYEEHMLAGYTTAMGTNLARTLAATPTNYMRSKDLVAAAEDVANKNRVVFNFIGESQLKEYGAGAFLSVIRGTKGSDGGIVHLKHTVEDPEAPTIAIVGKGVVFDTGGYDVKTQGYLDGMHRDMTGAAVSLGLFQALIHDGANCNVDLYLAVAENVISETAYKPNDVVTAMDGTSIEVKNTDAEGRMILADTILYAKNNKNAQTPDLIIDYATLTGAAVYSVDTRYSCVFSNSQYLTIDAMHAGTECGERVWGFPTDNDFMDSLHTSNVADINQCSDSENADHIYAACFLKYFAGDTPWVHIDLSSETCEGGLGLVDTEITGFGVRWGFEFIKKYIENEE